MLLSKKNIINGALIYSSGDTIAALIIGDFSWGRLLGIVLIGAFLYSVEIPYYFSWIDNKTKEYRGLKLSLYKTAWAILYFNPLWITRHMFFITLFSRKYSDITVELFSKGLLSFFINIPISLLANYIIQNKINYNWRFFASAIFSAIMAIYYAFSMIIF